MIEKLTEFKIQKLLEAHYSGNHIKYKIPNIFLFRYNWESDYVIVQRTSGYVTEFEIKCTKSDYKNDFKKYEKHNILNGIKKWDLKPNKFFYVVPENMITVKELPQFAGLIYVNKSGLKIIKEAKFIHKNKLNLEKHLCEKFYIYWRTAKAELGFYIRDKIYQIKIYDVL